MGCDLKFGGDWDAHTNPYGQPPGLYPRDDLAGLIFYESRDGLDNIFYNFPFARIRSSVNGGEVHGKVTFNTSGKSQGIFTIPTGSV